MKGLVNFQHTRTGRDLHMGNSRSETLLYPSEQKIKGLVTVQYSQDPPVPTRYLSFLETFVSFQSFAKIHKISVIPSE